MEAEENSCDNDNHDLVEMSKWNVIEMKDIIIEKKSEEAAAVCDANNIEDKDTAEGENSNPNNDDKDGIDLNNEIKDLEKNLEEWLQLRQETVCQLRDIATYIELIHKKSSIVKAASSGTGAIGGGLTLIGGALTIATGGLAAVPILIAGTSVGIAAAVTGGSAAISEKVIKSRQMKAAKAALEADQKVTGQIEEKLQSLALNKNFAKSVAKDVAKSGGNLTISSLTLNSLLIKTATSGGFLTKGLVEFASIFGDDVGKEMSKLIVVASGRLVSGSISIVTGGLTVAYDVYKLHSEIDKLVTQSVEKSAAELRDIADKLEQSLQELKVDEGQIETALEPLKN